MTGDSDDWWRMTPKVEWLQIANEKHQAGMRLECSCGYIEYFGDSPAGDLKMAEAKLAHRCPGSILT